MMDYKTLLSTVAMGTGVTGFNTHATEAYEPPQLSQESIVAFCKQANSILVLDGKDVCEPIQASKAATPPVTSTISPSTVTPPSIDVVPMTKIEETTPKKVPEADEGINAKYIILGGTFLGAISLALYRLLRKESLGKEKQREAVLKILQDLGIPVKKEVSESGVLCIYFTIEGAKSSNGKLDERCGIGILQSGELYMNRYNPNFSRLTNNGGWANRPIQYNPSLSTIKIALESLLESTKNLNESYIDLAGVFDTSRKLEPTHTDRSFPGSDATVPPGSYPEDIEALYNVVRDPVQGKLDLGIEE